jgi:hypothetical protein
VQSKLVYCQKILCSPVFMYPAIAVDTRTFDLESCMLQLTQFQGEILATEINQFSNYVAREEYPESESHRN